MSSEANFTSRITLEQELLRTAEHLETLLKIETGILRAESPRAVADVALEHLDRIIPCTASSVTLFQSSHTEAVVLAGRNTGVDPDLVTPAAPEQVKARKRGEALIIGDTAALLEPSAGMKLVTKMGGRSLLSIPMLAQGELIGNLTLIDTMPDTFTEKDVQITQQVGNSVAIAIHNAQLLEKEKKTRREAETLREVAASFSASLSQKSLLDLILSRLERVLPFESATIFLLEGDTRLTLAAHRGRDLEAPPYFALTDVMPPNITKALVSLQPLIIPDTELDPDWVDYPGGEFILCWLGVPLFTKENLIGLLMLDKNESNFYTDNDAVLALAFANQAAIAIENTQLYDEVRQYTEVLETRVRERTRELGALYEVTAIISQHQELEDTLDRVLSVISRALTCNIVAIQSIDEGGSTLSLLAHKGFSSSMVAYMQELSLNQLPIIRKILEQGEALIYSISQTDADLTDVPLPKLITFGVGTPIRVNEKDIGILGIASAQEEPPTEEDLALLTSIADHVGVAIENSRLRQQSKQLAVLEERERLARDLHDSATQSLFTLTLFAAAAREHLNCGELESINQQLIDLQETAVQTHKEMRLLLYELRPALLEEKGLEKALQQRMQLVEFRGGIRGQIEAHLAQKLPFSIEEVLFQVASEALNNTLKHSSADMVKIAISSDEVHVNMRIEDNGQGFSSHDENFSPGMGIDNMRRSVQQMGGTLRYEQQTDRGTIMVTYIPLENRDIT